MSEAMSVSIQFCSENATFLHFNVILGGTNHVNANFQTNWARLYGQRIGCTVSGKRPDGRAEDEVTRGNYNYGFAAQSEPESSGSLFPC